MNTIEQLSITGTVIFASSKPKTRVAVMPDRCLCLDPAECIQQHVHKRVIANLREAARFKKGETVKVCGRYRSQGFESVVLDDAEVR